jgi:hypothetical protein
MSNDFVFLPLLVAAASLLVLVLSGLAWLTRNRPDRRR